MWVNHHHLNNSLVVFVHGIFGNRWGTWKGVPDFVQSYFPTDPRLRSYDMFLFQYDTRVLFQPPLEPHIVGELRQFLARVGDKYQTTVLVGHSQGGIVIKLCVSSLIVEGKGDKLTVDLVITLGTPHRGRAILNPLYWAQQIPLVGRWIPLKQLGQLASRSANIRTLASRWNETYISRDPCAATRARRHVRSLAVTGAYDGLVSTRSATGFTVDEAYYLSLPHAGLAKIHTRAGDRLAEMLVEQLRRHGYPQGVHDAIRNILADPTAFEQYVKQRGPAVARQVALARPGLVSSGAVEIKTGSLLRDFLYEFPQRPLRNLEFKDALATYVQRRLEDTT